MDNYFTEHLIDLSRRSEKQNIYTYSDFLNLDEQNILYMNSRELGKFSVYGGAKDCERIMVKFGNSEEIGYDEDFPVICIKTEPVLQKFADTLSHRDILGALMNLGIERAAIGDIFLSDNNGYIFAEEKIAPYIIENLTMIKHTTVRCSSTDLIPERRYETEIKRFTVSSERLDCLLAAVCGLSRSKAASMIEAKRVFINGRLIESNSHITSPGDIVSVRGFGRFIYKEKSGTTKKGKESVIIEIFK